MSVEITIVLTDDQITQVAERAADLIADRSTTATEPWLDVGDAAKHLGISKSQLYSLTSQRHRNGLPVVKEGSRSFYRASDLDAWRTNRAG
jgi:hypothetical protein